MRFKFSSAQIDFPDFTTADEDDENGSDSGCPCKGVVYVALGDHGLVKIGSSRNTARRLKQLSLAGGLTVIRCYESPQHSNYQENERICHARFADSRRTGEWFAIAFDDVLTFLGELVLSQACRCLSPEERQQQSDRIKAFVDELVRKGWKEAGWTGKDAARQELVAERMIALVFGYEDAFPSCTEAFLDAILDGLDTDELRMLNAIQRENGRMLIQGKTYAERKQALLDRYIPKLEN